MQMEKLLKHIDLEYLKDILSRLLLTPSPTGFTDEVVNLVGKELEMLEVPFELTRRGAIRATIKGEQESPDRAMVAHLDTLGAMVKRLKKNGRLEIVSIGTWSARFAEGARVSIHTDTSHFRGTILPIKASGHAYDKEVDELAVCWKNLEVRIDETTSNIEDLKKLGINVGDFISVDSTPEFLKNGYINARHLDDKAGVAVILTVVKALQKSGEKIPVDFHPLFTISEEEGAGASSILHQDVATMITIDNSAIAPHQNSSERGITFAMRDQSGIFDRHLIQTLIKICEKYNLNYTRDIFPFYSSDSASAINAGNDIRTALVCFGLDASHGYERTHIDSLEALTKLMFIYLNSSFKPWGENLMGTFKKISIS